MRSESRAKARIRNTNINIIYQNPVTFTIVRESNVLKRFFFYLDFHLFREVLTERALVSKKMLILRHHIDF